MALARVGRRFVSDLRELYQNGMPRLSSAAAIRIPRRRRFGQLPTPLVAPRICVRGEAFDQRRYGIELENEGRNESRCDGDQACMKREPLLPYPAWS